MRRLALVALVLTSVALPAFAQSNEVGIVIGGSRRFVNDAPKDGEEAFLDSNFSLQNSAVDIFWGVELEPELWVKVKGGRIETQVPYVAGVDENGRQIRRDADGEVQHLELIAEYRFSEPYGSTGLFGGVGMYRHSTPEADARSDWGVTAGANADLPLSRRYGIVLEAAYHFTQAEFKPRYLTVGAGLRLSF